MVTVLVRKAWSIRKNVQAEYITTANSFALNYKQKRSRTVISLLVAATCLLSPSDRYFRRERMKLTSQKKILLLH